LASERSIQRRLRRRDVALVGDEVVLGLCHRNLSLNDVEFGGSTAFESRLGPIEEIAGELPSLAQVFLVLQRDEERVVVRGRL